jgi:hypothetical protein
VHGSGHASLALQFADVADVDQDDMVPAGELDRFLDRQRFDFAFGIFDEFLEAGGDGLRHGTSRCARIVAEHDLPLKPITS